MAAELGSERLCCNHMRQFLFLDWCPNFGKCDERHCAGLSFNSLATQTIALDEHMQELVANKRLTIQKSVVPAWKLFFGDVQIGAGQGAFCPVFRRGCAGT